jgi:hypothetical protein
MVDRVSRDKDTGYKRTTFPGRDPSMVNAVMLSLRDHGSRVYRRSTLTSDAPVPVTASVIDRWRASWWYRCAEGGRSAPRLSEGAVRALSSEHHQSEGGNRR